MPTYTYTSPTTGRQVKFSSAQPLSVEEQQRTIAHLEAPPELTQASAPPTAPAPSSGVVDPGYDEEWARAHGLLYKGFTEALNIVPKAVQQAAQNAVLAYQGKPQVPTGEALKRILYPSSNLASETVLQQLGMPEGPLRTITGFVGDVAMPTLPVGKLAKIPGMAKAGGAAAAKIGQLLTETKAGQAITPTLDTVERLFKQYPKLGKYVGKSGQHTAEDFTRLRDAAIEGAKTEALERYAKMFKGMTPDDAKMLAFHVDNPTDFPLPANRPDLQQVADAFRERMKLIQTAENTIGFGTKMRQNYVPYIIPGEKNLGRQVLEVPTVLGETPFAKARKLESLTAAEKQGGLTNLAQLGVLREQSSQRAIEHVNFTKKMAAEFGSDVPAEGYRQLDLNRVVLPDVVKAELKNVHFPTPIANELERSQLFYRDRNKLLTAYKGMNRFIKTIQTTLNPAYHMGNAQGNVTGQVLGGMDPSKAIYKTLKETSRINALLNDTAATAKIRKQLVKNTNMTVGQAFDTAQRYNLFGSSEAAAEFANALKGGQTSAGRVLNNARLYGSRLIEDPSRWALYLDQLEKGKTPEQAIIHTKNFMFDYNELTDFEKGLRDYGLVPYYSWKRKILPALVSGTAGNLRGMRKIQLAYGLPGKFAGENAPVAMPDWAIQEGYAPTPEFLQTSPIGNSELMRLNNPALALTEASDLRDLVGSNLGLIPKAAIEYLSKSDLRTGQPLLDTRTGQVKASPLGSVLENLRLAGAPVPQWATLGTRPTLDDEGRLSLVQNEGPAFLSRIAPVPFLPYAQQFTTDASSIGEPTTLTREIAKTGMRLFGLSPRDLTPEQQINILEQRAKELEAEPKRELLDLQQQQLEEALRNPDTQTTAAPAPSLVDRVMQVESAGNPGARSPKGALGLMQIMPQTAVEPGLPDTQNIFELAQQMGVFIPTRGTLAQRAEVLLRNPALNKEFGSQYLSSLLARYGGDVRRALVGYNWGPSHADTWDGTLTSLPEETRNYLSRILE